MWLSVLSNSSSTALHHFLLVIQHRLDAILILLEVELKVMGHNDIMEGGGTVGTGRSPNEWLESFWT